MKKFVIEVEYFFRIKKQKSGIFSSLKNLQNKKEKTSAYREASDIQSTQVIINIKMINIKMINKN